ncbi:MAG: hypothetical protein RIR36_1049, partial [Bacteroidota bacterium]
MGFFNTLRDFIPGGTKPSFSLAAAPKAIKKSGTNYAATIAPKTISRTRQ